MREELYNAAWGLGVRLRNLAKRMGLLGPFEPILLKLAPLLIQAPAKEVEIILPCGMKMVVPPGFPSARSYASGYYEKDVTHLFTGMVKEGMTVVDLGANVGYYSLLASWLVGASGRVYAFEPDRRAYAYLVRNVEANGPGNVMPVEKAVSDRTGSATLILDERGAEGWLSVSPRGKTSRLVQTTTLDHFFASEGWPAIDLVKMDIEGSEGAALAGMRELSRRNPLMKLIMEFNPTALRRAGISHEELMATLMELGFRRGQITERGFKQFFIDHDLPRMHSTYNLLLKKEPA